MTPYGDGTGPAGLGPGTGRGHGKCGHRNSQKRGGGWRKIFEVFRHSRSSPVSPTRESVAGQQGLVAQVDISRCTQCGICIEICPVSAVAFQNDKTVINPAACMGCGQCAQACPKDAIRLIERS